MDSFTIAGQIVDIFAQRIYDGSVTVQNGKIIAIREEAIDVPKRSYILPGFIDAHVHVESSLCVPSEFARLAVVHGTVATVSDPHEIANVLGIQGVRYMLQNAAKVPFKFYFGASPCVPATPFETAGAQISLKDIETLFKEDGLKYLSEMMNYPGVLVHDPEVMAKIELAKRLRKPIDGHAPGLMGEDARLYIEAGMSTDHECYRLDEAENKVRYGMKIIIREGTAAKNFEALHPIIKKYPHKVMFCSDDKHADDLVKSHINAIVRRAVWEKGYDLMTVLRSASLHPVQHYGLDVGLLRVGDPADFIVVDNLHDFVPRLTYINGKCVAKDGNTQIARVPVEVVNHFTCEKKNAADFAVQAEGEMLRVIVAQDGELITQSVEVPASCDAHGNLVPDVANDILKIVVVNRYENAKPAVAFIKNFGLKKGAIASSVAHDSHNIVAVGCDDESIMRAVNAVIASKGGLSAVCESDVKILPLPIGGLMSPDDGWKVAKAYEDLQDFVKSKVHTSLRSPYMTLSFMALLVIPELKLSDKGLFDGKRFQFTQLTQNL